MSVRPNSAGSGLNAVKALKAEQDGDAVTEDKPVIRSVAPPGGPPKPVAPPGGPPPNSPKKAAANFVAAEDQVDSASPQSPSSSIDDLKQKVKHLMVQGFDTGKLQEFLGSEKTSTEATRATEDDEDLSAEGNEEIMPPAIGVVAPQINIPVAVVSVAPPAGVVKSVAPPAGVVVSSSSSSSSVPKSCIHKGLSVKQKAKRLFTLGFDSGELEDLLPQKKTSSGATDSKESDAQSKTPLEKDESKGSLELSTTSTAASICENGDLAKTLAEAASMQGPAAIAA